LKTERFIPYFFVGLLFTFIGFSLFFYVNLDHYRIKKTEENVLSTLLSYKAFHQFNATFQRPIVEEEIKNGHLKSSFFAPELLSSSYGAKEIFNNYRSMRASLGMQDVAFKISSTNPTNPNNFATDHEKEILEAFNKGTIREYKKIITINNQKTLHYAMPFRPNDGSCMECHSDPKIAPAGMIEKYGDKNGFWEKEGEIRAMVSIYAPVESLFLNNSFYFIILTAVFIMLMIIFIIIVIVKKKLEHKDNLILQHAQNAAMGEMVSMLSHQWHHPLIKLGEISTKIARNNIDDPLSQKLQDQVSFLEDTMRNFRHFFSSHEMKKEYVHLDLVIEEAIRLFQNIYSDLNVSVELETKSEEQIFINKNELIQVIVNIFNNVKSAFEQSDTKSRKVNIRIEKEARLFKVSIWDNAGRCSEETIVEMFEANTNSDVALERGHLYLAYTIVKDQLEGKLFATNLGEGVCFEVYLPVLSDDKEER
jgi:two-component system, NtrC family, C4-dicarboxylate transport sensor histidine kinase DctB